MKQFSFFSHLAASGAGARRVHAAAQQALTWERAAATLQALMQQRRAEAAQLADHSKEVRNPGHNTSLTVLISKSEVHSQCPSAQKTFLQRV